MQILKRSVATAPQTFIRTTPQQKARIPGKKALAKYAIVEIVNREFPPSGGRRDWFHIHNHVKTNHTQAWEAAGKPSRDSLHRMCDNASANRPRINSD